MVAYDAEVNCLKCGQGKGGDIWQFCLFLISPIGFVRVLHIHAYLQMTVWMEIVAADIYDIRTFYLVIKWIYTVSVWSDVEINQCYVEYSRLIRIILSWVG